MAGIFKAYDIRGVYRKDLDEEIFYRIGLGFSNLIGSGKTIVCGRDGRPHSPPLQSAFIQGVRDGGTHVVDIALCTTPTVYFACATGGFDGAAMVTASHNPGAYNGLKFCREKAIPIGYSDGLDQIEAWVRASHLKKSDETGTCTHRDFKSGYLDFLTHSSRFSRKFRFAVDCGNGMGGFLIGEYLERVGQSAQPLFWDLDFSFPNHPANPLDFKTLKDLQELIRRDGLDFGVAFDGDADRCFFVDNHGEIIPADLLTALLAVDFLKKGGPSAIVYDIRSSKVVAEKVREMGGTPVLCRVGHSFMKAKLREHNGIFGGELAGHFYFKDFFFADSAFYTMIAIMNILDETGQSLADLIAPFRKYVPSGEINFHTDRADAFLDEAPGRFPNGELLTIDGVRLDFADWWFSLRKSNTEPLLRLVVEADSRDLLDRRVSELKTWLIEGGAELEH